MEYKNDNKLTFPQRNWLMLCILTAVITAFIYYLIDTRAGNGSAGYHQVQSTASPSSVTTDTQQAEGIPPDSLHH